MTQTTTNVPTFDPDAAPAPAPPAFDPDAAPAEEAAPAQDTALAPAADATTAEPPAEAEAKAAKPLESDEQSSTLTIKAARSELAAAIKAVSGSLGRPSSVPALSGVLLAAVDGGITVTAINHEVAHTVPVQATTSGKGRMLIPGRLFGQLLDAVRTDAVELAASKGEVTLTAGRATYKLRLLRLADFPSLPTPKTERTIVLDAETYRTLTGRVIRSVSLDETRPILGAVHLAAEASTITLRATDSYRAAIASSALKTALPEPISLQLPGATVKTISAMLARHDSAEVTLSGDRQHIRVTVADEVLVSTLVAGQYPNLDQILAARREQEDSSVIAIDPSILRGAVDRAALLTRKDAAVRLKLTDGQLALHGDSPDIGEAHETLPLPAYKGEDEIGLNPQYLREALESVGDAGQVTLRLSGALKPALLEIDGVVHVLMPIRLPGA